MKIFQKLSLSLAFCVTAVGSALAQDARFSQYYAAPMRLNPAMTGVFEGNWRVGANYRTQYGSILGNAYNTYSVNGEGKFSVGSQDYVAVGLSATADAAGSAAYKQTDMFVSASYLKRLSKTRRRYGRNRSESFLAAGAQVGFGQRGVNWANLTYSTQYVVDDNTYNQGMYSGESNNARANRIYPDMSAGLLWYGTFGRRRSVYVGGAVYHVNRPNISLFNDAARDTSGRIVGTTERLYMRWVGHAGGEVLLGGDGSSISLLPGMAIMAQGPSLEVNAGLSLRYQGAKFDDFAFRLGVWNRLSNRANRAVAADAAKLGTDAVVLMLGIDYRGLQMGFSYDATLSSLQQQVNGQGSMEFSVIYTHDGDLKRGQGCPTF